MPTLQSVPQPRQIPPRNRWLRTKLVPAVVVNLVGNKLLVVAVEKAKHVQVDGNAKQAHVVRVHHPVRKSGCLPAGHKRSQPSRCSR